MTVKEFKNYLRQFRDDESVTDVISAYICCTKHEECTYILQQAVDRLSRIAAYTSHKNTMLTQQLTMTQLYLQGDMYKDEETARAMLPVQIDNIEKVLHNY